MKMKFPRPRDAIDRAHQTTTFILWSAGVGLLFAPAAATLLLFATDPLVGPIGSNSPRGNVTLTLCIAAIVAGVAMYLVALQQAHRFGRAHGHHYRHVDHNPKIVIALWVVQFAASWAALGLLFGRIDMHAVVDPIHLEHGIGLFLLAFGTLMAFWALGRFRSRH
jgi:heme/copper-type cytochrome/quinol oxidase subunit 2